MRIDSPENSSYTRKAAYAGKRSVTSHSVGPPEAGSIGGGTRVSGKHSPVRLGLLMRVSLKVRHSRRSRHIACRYQAEDLKHSRPG